MAVSSAQPKLKGASHSMSSIHNSGVSARVAYATASLAVSATYLLKLAGRKWKYYNPHCGGRRITGHGHRPTAS